jgi:AcrR family transcriptional regulator
MEAGTSVPARPRRADAQRNRARVLEAATEAFAELGLDARIEEIARRAEVGVGTVYRHFPTKEALMGELLAEKWRTLRDQARESLENESDPWEAFAGSLRRNAETMSRDAAVRDDIMRLDSPTVWEHAEEAKAELVEVTAELVERGRAAGVLREDLTVEDVPMMMCGVCSTMGTGGPSGPLDWRRHLELVLEGTRRRSP